MPLNKGRARPTIFLMEWGDALVVWSVRLSVLLYAAALALGPRAWNDPSAGGWPRRLWTLGWALCVLHVALSFHFVHQWSHAAAYEATARQTSAVTGLDWGGGVYVNYLFLLVWGGDAAWWWANPQGHRTRPRVVAGAVHAFLAFIVFNATVVFAAGPVRWFALAAGGLLAWRLLGPARPGAPPASPP